MSIKEDVLRKIEANFPEIRECFGIETLGIFGSVARGEDTPESDVDVLYTYQEGKCVAYFKPLTSLITSMNSSGAKSIYSL